MRAWLLIQGSVQPPPVKLARADWEQAMCEVAEAEFAVKWMEFAPGDAFRQRVAELTKNTYAQAAYNQRR
jgi:hypothetical protein